MTTQILQYGSPLLRSKSQNVKNGYPVNDDFKVLFKILEEFDGIGLSGVQIGIMKRMFVIDTTNWANENPEIPAIKKAYVNPVILNKSDNLTSFGEGCLSIPGIHELVDRPESITVKYKDVMFNTIEEELNGIEARIFQHEYDHLDGILFIDRLSPLRKVILEGKIKKIKKNALSMNRNKNKSL